MSRILKSGKQSDEDAYTFVLSTSDVDRVGDIVEVDGIDLKDFRKNPIALWSHNSNFPIGTWSDIRIEGKKLLGKLKLAAPGTSRLIDELRSLLEQRILKAVSIGFSVIEASALRDTNGYRFTRTALHEASLVAVPANQHALRVKSLSDEAKKTFFIGTSEDDDEGRIQRARTAFIQKLKETKTGVPLAVVDNPTFTQKGYPMSLADKIKAKKERLVAIKDELVTLKSILEADGYEMTDDDTAKLTTLTDEQTSVTKSLEALEKIEASLATKAAPVSGPTGYKPPGTVASKEMPGTLLTKSAVVSLLAHMQRKSHADVIAEIYGSDQRIAPVHKMFVMQKSAVDLADTTTAGWAAELVRNDIRGFLEELRPVSVYAQLAAQSLSLDFGGASTVTIPRRTGGNTDLAGAFVGEGGVIPVKKTQFGSSTLARYKMAVISAFTNELLEQSVPSIEALVRAAIVADTAVALDNALLSAAAAVPGVRPAGLLNGVALTPSGGATTADVITDIRVLLAAMMAANFGAKPVLIMNSNRLLGLSTATNATGQFMFRDEIAQGRLLGVPVIASPTVASGTVIVVDANSFAAANDVPSFMVSDQATLTMANADGTAPTQAMDAAGAIGTAEQVPPDKGILVAHDGAATAAEVGYKAMSMYQQYSTAVRMILPTSWGLMRPGTVAGLSGVDW